MTTPELQARLQTVRSHYLATPWIEPRDDESPLLRSWQRSRDAGLREGDRVEFDLVARSQLAELDDRHGDLVRAARPETERLAAALQGTGAAVMLFNTRGTIIDRLCHEATAPNVLRTVSRVGVNVSERCMGTTAPAITLAEGLPYLVGRDAHFCVNLRPFFCVAAPIDSPTGERLAALDITSYDQVPAFDVYALVVDAAAAIENSLFQPTEDHVLVHFHPRAEYLGSPLEGIVEVGDNGRITGANRAAARLLCQRREALLQRHVRDLFDRDPGRLRTRGAAPPDRVAMQTPQGLLLWARFEGLSLQRPLSMPGAALPPPAPAPSSSLRDIERATIDRVLQQHGGNVTAAARQLGISRNSVYRKRSPDA
jgi:sigma-54 dependent transcriptional regulator, acetoin dehydrogenase operon transcriptional activator AcoR